MKRTLKELVDSSINMTPAQQRTWYADLPREEQKTLELTDVYYKEAPSVISDEDTDSE